VMQKFGIVELQPALVKYSRPAEMITVVHQPDNNCLPSFTAVSMPSCSLAKLGVLVVML